MAEITLNVQTREGIGSQAVRKLRSKNLIPGIYYFRGGKNVPFVVDRAELHSIWGHETGLLDVVFDGKQSKKCVIREIQFDPVKGKPIHLDLLGIKMTEKIRVNVHVQLTGTAEGVKNSGGVLQHVLREVEIECLPSDLPESIEVDVTSLGIGGSIHISDINLPNVTFHADASAVVATVSAPRVVAEEVTEGEEMAEPEVITKKQEETE